MSKLTEIMIAATVVLPSVVAAPAASAGSRTLTSELKVCKKGQVGSRVGGKIGNRKTVFCCSSRFDSAKNSNAWFEIKEGKIVSKTSCGRRSSAGSDTTPAAAAPAAAAPAAAAPAAPAPAAPAPAAPAEPTPSKGHTGGLGYNTHGTVRSYTFGNNIG